MINAVVRSDHKVSDELAILEYIIQVPNAEKADSSGDVSVDDTKLAIRHLKLVTTGRVSILQLYRKNKGT